MSPEDGDFFCYDPWPGPYENERQVFHWDTIQQKPDQLTEAQALEFVNKLIRPGDTLQITAGGITHTLD